MSEWIAVKDHLPEDGIVVDTKIEDYVGARNYQPLRRRGRLWFFANESMYVYYVPTHWKPRHEESA